MKFIAKLLIVFVLLIVIYTRHNVQQEDNIYLIKTSLSKKEVEAMLNQSSIEITKEKEEKLAKNGVPAIESMVLLKRKEKNEKKKEKSTKSEKDEKKEKKNKKEGEYGIKDKKKKEEKKTEKTHEKKKEEKNIEKKEHIHQKEENETIIEPTSVEPKKEDGTPIEPQPENEKPLEPKIFELAINEETTPIESMTNTKETEEKIPEVVEGTTEVIKEEETIINVTTLLSKNQSKDSKMGYVFGFFMVIGFIILIFLGTQYGRIKMQFNTEFKNENLTDYLLLDEKKEKLCDYPNIRDI